MSGRRSRMVCLSGQQDNCTRRRAMPLQESPFHRMQSSHHERLSMSGKGWRQTASSNAWLRMRRVKARIVQLLRRLKRSMYCRIVQQLRHSVAGFRCSRGASGGGFTNAYCSPRTSTSYPDAVADCIEFIKKSAVSSDSRPSKAK